MRDKIIKYCGRSKIVYCSGKYFLLDYSACDKQLAINLSLLESLIEKHFNVTYRAGYLGIRELRFV
jgi:hypothetical protein